MATNKRTFPNDYYVWYNDDDRIAILVEERDSVTGERTTEKFDTFQGTGSTGSITAFADYVAGSHDNDILVTSADHGLSTGDVITITNADTSAHNVVDGSVTKVSKDTFYVEAVFGATSTATWTADNVVDGIRVTFHSKYEEITDISHDLKTNGGLDSALHNSILCYVKARLYEDTGNFQEAQYFRMMYEAKVRKHISRKSGVRFLAVPRL